MYMKHEPTVIANTVAATTAIVYVACRVLVGLFPDASFAVAQSWFHGIELSKLDSWNLTMPAFILGLVSLTITGWLTGYLFATVYTYFSKK